MESHAVTFEALRLEAAATSFDKIEAMAFLSNHGVPLEVLTRMETLWEQTVIAGHQVFHIGKIIILHLIRFIQENPNLVIGLAIGLSLGLLVSAVPVIGSFIAPVVTVVATTMFALRGHRLDKALRGDYIGESYIEDAITLVKEFWYLLYEIFNSIGFVNPAQPAST